MGGETHHRLPVDINFVSFSHSPIGGDVRVLRYPADQVIVGEPIQPSSQDIGLEEELHRLADERVWRHRYRLHDEAQHAADIIFCRLADLSAGPRLAHMRLVRGLWIAAPEWIGAPVYRFDDILVVGQDWDAADEWESIHLYREAGEELWTLLAGPPWADDLMRLHHQTLVPGPLDGGLHRIRVSH